MPIRVNSSGWKIKRAGVSRGRLRADVAALPGLPADFLTASSRVADEAIVEPVSGTLALGARSETIDLSCDVRPRHTAILAIRLPSGALTFHRPVQTTTRSAAGPSTARFHVTVRTSATRGLDGPGSQSHRHRGAEDSRPTTPLAWRFRNWPQPSRKPHGRNAGSRKAG